MNLSRFFQNTLTQKVNGSPLTGTSRQRLLKASLILTISTSWMACTAKYTIKSYPEGAQVFVKDVVGSEKKLVGATPLTVKKTKEMGEVFFLSIEKDNFFPKQVLMTPSGGEDLTISVNLDPMQDGKKASGDEDKGKDQQGQAEQAKKAEDEKREMAMRVALLENTVSIYKDALFSGRYSGGIAPYDRDRTDDIVDHIFKSQQLVVGKKYNDALTELDKALAKDEYLPQAYLIKGTIFYIQKQYEQAKISWERCLRIDPYNAQAYNYLRLVDKKLGLAQPPEKPSLLRTPANDEFSRSLRE